MIKMRWLPIFLLVAVVSLLYVPFLDNPLVFDDQDFFETVNGMMPGTGLFAFSLFELRWLPYASLAWISKISGDGLLVNRTVSMLMHVMVVLTLFAFLSTLFRAVITEKYPATGGLPVVWHAFFGAMLFGLHPAAVYAAGYLVQRSIVMATLFGLLALWAYLRGLESERGRWVWLSVLFYVLSVLSKEHAVMLPWVMVALTILLRPDWKGRMLSLWQQMMVMMMVALYVAIKAKHAVATSYEPNAVDMANQIGVASPFAMSILSQCWLFFKYLALWLLPNPAWMSIDMRESFPVGWQSVYLFAPMLFVAYGALGFYLLLKRGLKGLLGLAMLFPWLLFFTELATVRIQEPFVLYRSYLWMAGVVVALPIVFSRVTAKGAATILVVVVVAFIPLSLDRLVSFSHSVLLWDDAVKLVENRPDVPGAFRPYYSRGTSYLKLDLNKNAIVDLERSIELNHEQPDGLANLAWGYYVVGRVDDSIEFFNQAINVRYKNQTIKTPNPRYHYGRAIALEKAGRKGDALIDYRVSCALGWKGCEEAKEIIGKLPH